MKTVQKLISICTVIIISASCAAKKDLAELQDTHANLQQSLIDEQSENQNLKNQISELETRVTDLQEENDQLSMDLQESRNSISEVRAELQEARSNQPEPTTSGTIFKVQLGAYEKIELSDELDKSSSNFDMEKKNAINQYVIGQFRDYYKADRLKKQLRRMGVKDAWIVPYVDGKRVELDTVIEGIEGS